MKKLIQLAVVVMSSVAMAQVTEGSLKLSMKEMSSLLKTISLQATDASKNANSAELAGKFVDATTAAKSFTPSTANDDVAKAKYNEMIDGVIAKGKALQEAFLKNDNAQASVLLNQLVQDKKDGHSEFKQ